MPDEFHAPDPEEARYEGSGQLRGKVALITGGTSGIGRAVAIAFAREGADLALGHHHSGDGVAETEGMAKASGGDVLTIKADISTESDCERLVAETIARFGRIDVLVNNAAAQMAFERIEDIATKDWELMFRTNIHAPFWLSRAAVPHMAPGSSIINTTSLQAKVPSPELAAYAATKGALTTFTAALAIQLAPRGIRVNAVAPGPITTPLIPDAMPDDSLAEFGRDTPLGRPGRSSELAGIYVLLASARSSYMTGGIYPVTGGIPML